MRLPWVARSTAELLAALVEELKAERKLLLDRLATLGLGGPLFAANEEKAQPEEPMEELAQDPAQEMFEKLQTLRHRPTRLADAVSRELRRRQGSPSPSARVAWIPAQQEKVSALLDEAEEQGRKQA